VQGAAEPAAPAGYGRPNPARKRAHCGLIIARIVRLRPTSCKIHDSGRTGRGAPQARP